MHKRTLVLGAAALLAACATNVAPPPTTDAQVLLGVWTVDLRPRPDAPAYLKSLKVTSISGKTFAGEFYDTPITEGRINVAWGTVRIAFVTADGTGTYLHSAVLNGARLEGLTNATTRGFLAYWSAVKP